MRKSKVASGLYDLRMYFLVMEYTSSVLFRNLAFARYQGLEARERESFENRDSVIFCVYWISLNVCCCGVAVGSARSMQRRRLGSIRITTDFCGPAVS